MTDPVLLLVEDNATDEELTLRALHRSKVAVDVVVARDGAEALDYLFATGVHAGSDRLLPHVVVLDLKLPKLSGLEVVRRIRAHPETSRLRIVVLSSSNEHRDVAGCYREGADGYVVKPVDSTEYAEAVGRLAWYWLVVNLPAAPGARASSSNHRPP